MVGSVHCGTFLRKYVDHTLISCHITISKYEDYPPPRYSLYWLMGSIYCYTYASHSSFSSHMFDYIKTILFHHLPCPLMLSSHPPWSNLCDMASFEMLIGIYIFAQLRLHILDNRPCGTSSGRNACHKEVASRKCSHTEELHQCNCLSASQVPTAFESKLCHMDMYEASRETIHTVHTLQDGIAFCKCASHT